jgi:putative DNA primase/helicase
MLDTERQFAEAIQAAGLTPPEVVVANGRLARFRGSRKQADCWYVLHSDGIPAGCFGDWRTGLVQSWRAEIGRPLTHAEEALHRQQVQAMRQERKTEEVKRHAEARERAKEIWERALPCREHPYLAHKQIQAHGARVHEGRLVVPMRLGGELQSLQFIGADGSKRFLSGGRVAGCYCSLGKMKGAGALCITEGFATGASIHEATGHPVAAAANAGNLLEVAKELRQKYPDLPLILCADDDCNTPGNPGLTKATEAAQAVGGLMAVPDFGDSRPDGATDFNDMAAHCGAEAVARAVSYARSMDEPDCQPANAESPAGEFGDWPEPQSLSVKMDPEPYPIDALPMTIRAAVEEVAAFVKAPLPLIAASALSALSLAIQAHSDAKRAERLHGPSSLYLLTIADSGERKSTCDGFFTKAIQEYQEAQTEAAKPVLSKHMAELEAWEAECLGIKEKIRSLAKNGQPTVERREALRELHNRRPKPLRIPRLLYSDVTPEALAFGLATHWPSGGVVSSEAGIVFGAHGMNKESIMRNLSLLNLLWDGNSVTIDRRSKESFTLSGARMTVALQVQEPTLREFIEKSGSQARGSGFLSRFLVAWPESTQGSRPFTEAPENWSHLAEFNRRIAAILARPVHMDEGGALLPVQSTLTPEAKAVWRAYHDNVETQLSSGGKLHDVRDVASKSADNVARLAVLFHCFEHGEGEPVSVELLTMASRLGAWHLNESRRFFSELNAPPELLNAARLDRWLLAYCRRENAQSVPIGSVQRGGPSGLRIKSAIEGAMSELMELNRARWMKTGKRRLIALHPALLAGDVH